MDRVGPTAPCRVRLLDGRELELLPTFGALAEAAEITGRSAVEILESRDLVLLSALWWASVVDRPGDLTLERFRRLLPLSLATIEAVTRGMAEALGGAEASAPSGE